MWMNNRKYEISMLNEEIDRLFRLIEHITQKTFKIKKQKISL